MFNLDVVASVELGTLVPLLEMVAQQITTPALLAMPIPIANGATEVRQQLVCVLERLPKLEQFAITLAAHWLLVVNFNSTCMIKGLLNFAWFEVLYLL